MTDWTADRVRALRSRLGLTQHQFAARIGCHRQAVANWESGQRTPTGLYATSLQSLEDSFMTVTITHVEEMSDIKNTVLRDLAWACVGDQGSLERVDADHVGGLVYAGYAEDSDTGSVCELVVISYDGAGCQLFLGTDDGEAPTAIDLHVAATFTLSDELRAAIQRVMDAWYRYDDSLDLDILADPADIYAA